MKYFFDTEFIEGTKQRRVLGIKVGPPVPTIDLISIGMVAEDGRELYLLNADCELEYAWASEWVRKNVLLPIWEEYAPPVMRHTSVNYFSLESLRKIFKERGKTRQQLTGEIVAFVYPLQYLADELNKVLHVPGCSVVGSWQGEILEGPGVGEYYDREEAIEWALQIGAPIKPQFYADYADYDWVVFCQLFGRMIALPKGFPMYCNDLKQEQDRQRIGSERKKHFCPDPEKKHHALEDARWAKRWHGVLQRLALDSEDASTDMGKIRHMLHVPALGSKPVVEKVATLLNMVKRAAEGEKISNRPEDYS